MTRGPPTLPAACPGCLQPFAYPLADDVSLHLRKGRLNLQKGATSRRRGVHRRVQRAKTDATLVEPVDESDELACKPPEAVEVLDDEDIARPQVIEARGEVGPLGCGARSAILENAVATGSVQRVELAMKHLAPFCRGDARVSDESHAGNSP